MTAAAELPRDLADLPPGPGLATVLAGIDPTRVANNQLLPVLRASTAKPPTKPPDCLGIIAEIGRADPTFDDDEIDRLPHPFLHAPDEIRAALAWSRRGADNECELAEQLVHDLPLVYAAFLDGLIDRSKVRVFADHLAGLPPEQTEQICRILVPIAGRLTPGQIAHRLRRLIAAIDPRHYERRYRKALRDRYVTAHLDDHGVVNPQRRPHQPDQRATSPATARTRTTVRPAAAPSPAVPSSAAPSPAARAPAVHAPAVHDAAVHAPAGRITAGRGAG